MAQEVIDGDSLEIVTPSETIVVRLIGINANERGECYYDEARDYLSALVEGREVGVEHVGADQFDRVLANVWIGDELINLSIVAAGNAIAQTPEGANPYGELLIDAEEMAWESRSGLWSPDACGSTTTPDVSLELTTVDPDGPDEEFLADEVVTVTNEGSTPLDVSGWVLRDESSRNRLTITATTPLVPGEPLDLDSACTGPVEGCTGTPIWNNDGDMALLLDSNGTVVARARY